MAVTTYRFPIRRYTLGRKGELLTNYEELVVEKDSITQKLEVVDKKTIEPVNLASMLVDDAYEDDWASGVNAWGYMGGYHHGHDNYSVSEKVTPPAGTKRIYISEKSTWGFSEEKPNPVVDSFERSSKPAILAKNTTV